MENQENEQLLNLYNTFFKEICTYEKFKDNVSLEFIQVYFSDVQNNSKLFKEKLKALCDNLKNL